MKVAGERRPLPLGRCRSGGLASRSGSRHPTVVRGLVAEGQRPAIVDSRELLLDPPGVLAALCDHLEIPFYEDMLSWEAGPREEDGIWAPHWYHAVHKSTGFSPYSHKTTFPDHLRPLLAECAPWYDKLFAHAIRANA